MKLGNQITKVRRINPETYCLVLEFSDGFSGEVDLSQLFSQKKKKLISEVLRGNLFARCFVQDGALAWPNGYELCPDALRAWIEDRKKQIAA